jgi:hypothetical protein
LGRMIAVNSDVSELARILSRSVRSVLLMEMMNKQLRIWARDGWIKLERRRLVVLRRDALARIADLD